MTRPPNTMEIALERAERQTLTSGSQEGLSLSRQAWRRIRRRPIPMICLSLIFLFAVVALLDTDLTAWFVIPRELSRENYLKMEQGCPVLCPVRSRERETAHRLDPAKWDDIRIWGVRPAYASAPAKSNPHGGVLVTVAPLNLMLEAAANGDTLKIYLLGTGKELGFEKFPRVEFRDAVLKTAGGNLPVQLTGAPDSEHPMVEKAASCLNALEEGKTPPSSGLTPVRVQMLSKPFQGRFSAYSWKAPSPLPEKFEISGTLVLNGRSASFAVSFPKGGEKPVDILQGVEVSLIDYIFNFRLPLLLAPARDRRVREVFSDEQDVFAFFREESRTHKRLGKLFLTVENNKEYLKWGDGLENRLIIEDFGDQATVYSKEDWRPGTSAGTRRLEAYFSKAGTRAIVFAFTGGEENEAETEKPENLDRDIILSRLSDGRYSLEYTVEGWRNSGYAWPWNEKNEYLSWNEKGHLLGTDKTCQDILWLAIKGFKTAMIIGGGVMLLSIPLGIFFGIVAGYFGGRIDDLITWAYTTLASIPFILLMIALLTALRGWLDRHEDTFTFLSPHIFLLVTVLGTTGWVGLCKLIRGETLKHKAMEYVQAAKALGAGHCRILFRHILPNVFHLVIINFSLAFGGLVMSETFLTYLGIGVGQKDKSWGNMIKVAQNEMAKEPIFYLNFLAASGMIFMLVLAFNIFGDALRDALDPRLKD